MCDGIGFWYVYVMLIQISEIEYEVYCGEYDGGFIIISYIFDQW